MFDLSKFQDGVGAQQSPLANAIQAPEEPAPDVSAIEEHRQHVTRPYSSGYATLAVRIINGDVVAATDQFILASFNEQDQERTSVRYTLGDSILFSGAGRQPKIYTYSGFLVDTVSSGPSISHWRKIYDKYLRGTKCARNKAVVELEFRDQKRIGYINSCTMSYDATKPRIAMLSFIMFVIKEKNNE